MLRTSLVTAMLLGTAEGFQITCLKMTSVEPDAAANFRRSAAMEGLLAVSQNSRRGFLLGGALLLPSLALAEDVAAPESEVLTPAKKKSAEILAKQMAVINFTKKIDEASEKAFKLANKGDLKGAAKQWDIVVSVYETGGDGVVLTPQALYRLGKSLGERANVLAELGKQRKKGEFIELAVADYRRSLSFVPNNDMRLKLATALIALEKYKEADKEFSDVLKDGGVSNEVKGRAYNNRGLARSRLANWEGAVADYTEAVEATRGSPEAVSNLALASFQLGDSKKALDMLMGQVKTNPVGLETIEGAADIPAAVAAMEFAGGNKDQALKSLTKVKDPRYRDVRYVEEGRLWPPKLVEAMKGLLADAKAKGV